VELADSPINDLFIDILGFIHFHHKVRGQNRNGHYSQYLHLIDHRRFILLGHADIFRSGDRPFAVVKRELPLRDSDVPLADIPFRAKGRKHVLPCYHG
jgi:hypothetical protein